MNGVMELVFFYINQTSSKFIEKKGFNFSANYNFNVEYFDGRYVLKQNECNVRLPEYFFDDKGCITNITAIVGENGAGKTTLLNQISNYYGSVKDKLHDLQYEEFFSQRYEEDKTIAIYLDDAKLVCYHNIDNFENETNVETIFLYQGSAELMNIVKNNRAFENVSKICLSNSMYSLEDGVSTHRSISKIALNVNSLKTLKNIFYKKKCRNVSSCAGGYYEFQDILCNAKSVNEVSQNQRKNDKKEKIVQRRQLCDHLVGRRDTMNAESNETLPVSEKYMLIIKEAAAYFNIGIKKLRRIAEDNLGTVAVYCGNRFLIIRPKFEEFILNSSEI